MNYDKWSKKSWEMITKRDNWWWWTCDERCYWKNGKRWWRSDEQWLKVNKWRDNKEQVLRQWQTSDGRQTSSERLKVKVKEMKGT